MLRLEAIQKFLSEHAKPDLAALFSDEMELHVNVHKDEGEPVEGVTKSGHRWSGFSDGKTTWKNFRVPWGADTENPNYTDRKLGHDPKHFEAIGMTGWNWAARTSHWVGFDFDSLIGHKAGLSDAELLQIRKKVEDVPWVTIRKSTSGRGLHLYIHLEPAIPTATHTEHAALARSILGILSVIVGYQLHDKVDTCGGVLWVWHRRMVADGYSLIRQGECLSDVPVNWRDHVEAVRSGARRQRVKAPVAGGEQSALDELVNKTKVAPLDDGHRLVFAWLSEHKSYWWWDQDRHMMVAHTFDLLQCHKEMKLKGPFYTLSTGKDQGRDQNCFAFPLRNGAWVVRRHSRRTPEHASWSFDSGGWTRCYFNHPATLATASRCHGGTERPDGRFEFSTLESAITALKDLGAIQVECDPWMLRRPALLREHRDGRVVLSAQATANDPFCTGWTRSKDAIWYERLVDVQNEQPEVEVPDEFVRHLIEGGVDAGWYIYTRSRWVLENEGNVRKALAATGIPSKNHATMLGQCVLHPWMLVCRPFQPEYPGNRVWNRDAPQLAYDPTEGDYSTWKNILDHCGEGLNDAVASSDWCRQAGVVTGGQYLFFWVASLFQFPTEPLPYLFFHGKARAGKSIFHEALMLLFKDRRGIGRADTALTSQGRFNGELSNMVCCIVEELNLRSHREAYSRIKDWVTGRTILIHRKGLTPGEELNLTHWIQIANDAEYCPILPGDARIVMSEVRDNLGANSIPKPQLISRLEVEGPAVLHALLTTTIPPANDRLRIPVVTTAEKLMAEHVSETDPIRYVRENIYSCPGALIPLPELYLRFQTWLPPHRRMFWPESRFFRAIPSDMLLRGRQGGTTYYAANVSFTKDAPPTAAWVLEYDKLIRPTNGAGV